MDTTGIIPERQLRSNGCNAQPVTNVTFRSDVPSRPVSKGEKGIAILAPVVRMVEVDVTAEDTSTQAEERRRIVAFTQAYVFDISQTQGVFAHNLVKIGALAS